MDEAQDLCVGALRFAVGMLRDPDRDLLIVSDAAQNVFGRTFNWRDAGIQARGRTQILRRNYRNTREILEFASLFLMGDDGLRWETTPDDDDTTCVIGPEEAVRLGPTPELIQVTDRLHEHTAVVDRVVEWLDEVGGPQSIGVLCWRNHQVDVIHKALGERDVRADCLSIGAVNSDAPVIVSTIHSSKGLQFPRVVLFDIPTDHSASDRGLLLTYVGMTRAMHQLAVVVTTSHPLLPNLVAASPVTA